jgi:4-aminobutyrate aminotransferase-like enzyme
MLPHLVTAIPGPRSLALAERLRRVETHNVTYLSESWPIFWERADGSAVWDADGNRFLDLTSAFGVAGLGHSRPEVVRALWNQSERLIHAMGDVHPTELKVRLCERLSAMTFERWGAGPGKTTLSNSGFEAVESALKTALIATGRAGVVTFHNAYHGLGYGALLGAGIDKFRAPFSGQLAAVAHHLDFPRSAAELSACAAALNSLDPGKIGALLVEPIQGRGGKVVPPAGFLAMLRDWCDAHRVVLIFDEIYSGFNRTGKLFACEWDAVVPDLICLGKGLSSGFPISACVGKAAVMDAWPVSTGEALHTSTFLGNPLGCAMALAATDIHLRPDTAAQVQATARLLVDALHSIEAPGIVAVRGRGLMLGMQLGRSAALDSSARAGHVLEEMLRRGVIMLADGPAGDVLAFTPPFALGEADIRWVAAQLGEVLRTV